MKTERSLLFGSQQFCGVCLTLFAAWTVPSALGETLYREDFNTDGSVGPQPRYTITGGFLSEAPHDPVDVPNAADQLGPVFWGRNTEASYVGVPAPTKGRRALLTWDGALAPGSPTSGASPEMMQLVENAVKWLAKDKPNATIAFSPNIAIAQPLADHLAQLGYAVVDDDRVTADTAYPADAIIKGPDNELASRFANAPQGVLAFGAIEHDDMLTSSIGSVVNFQPGEAAVVNSAHPVASGVPASFVAADVTANWNLMGDTLPGGAITIATMVRVIPPTVATLADVDAMVAGTKQTTKSTATVTELDFAENSAGDWFFDNPIPGGAAGLWGLVARGKLDVAAAGRYSFAIGVDDGARLRIDRNRNGLGPEDNVIVEDVAGAHRALYANVDFAATGLYDFEVTVFNSGGAGSIEMSVSLQSGGGDTSPISSGSWELIGSTTGGVSLDGEITADSYVPSGPADEVTVPLLVLLNGPDDTPPGSVFGGGPFGSFEGTGFFAGSGLNKWNPVLIESLGGYRSVRLTPVDVTGKPDVKVTVALAATFLDFETTDFLDIVAFPTGVAGPEVRLARFSAPNATTKFFVDVQNGGINRLGLEFRDVTYNVPAGATSLVIEIRSFTSWWNEIVGFDDIRITSGATAITPAIAIGRDGGDLVISFTGTLQNSTTLAGWGNVPGNPTSPFRIPASSLATQPLQFFRAAGQ